MDFELSKFLDWVSRRLQHLHPQKRQDVIFEIESYLNEAQRKQNISHHALIHSLGDKIQFINGFLLRLGERPLSTPRRPLRIFLIILASLFTIGSLSLVGLYYYFSSQFDFDLDGGKLKFFGQIIDIDKVDFAYSTDYRPDGQGKKYVRKEAAVDAQSNFQIELENTRTTISFHRPEENSYLIECEIEYSQELTISSDKSSKQNNFIIEVAGGSNCDLTLPQTATFQLNFANGRITLDGPSSSFKVHGTNGNVTWIKNLASQFRIFYDVQNAFVRGGFKNIFNQNASQAANIKLTNGMISFVDP